MDKDTQAKEKKLLTYLRKQKKQSLKNYQKNQKRNQYQQDNAVQITMTVKVVVYK